MAFNLLQFANYKLKVSHAIKGKVTQSASMGSLLISVHCTAHWLAVAQFIVIGPVCLWVCLFVGLLL